MKKLSFIANVFGKKQTNRRIGSLLYQAEARTRRTMEKWIADRGWAENISFEELSAKLGLSKQKISLYAHHYHHTSFSHLRTLLRIEEAKRLLLENPKLPSSLIAELVGISDKSNFRRLFRQVTGYYPGEWRKLKQ